jgi:hypothetical protein
MGNTDSTYYFDSDTQDPADTTTNDPNNPYDDSYSLHMDIASQRIELGQEAGDVYIAKLESIRDELDATDNSGTTLGTMVAAQLKMTEAETEYMVRAGVPKKASQQVQAAANDVKKAAG